MSAHRSIALIVAWLGSLWLWWPGPVTAQSVDVFKAFTGHIEQQIKRDKQSFLDAQACTEWFYRQQRKPRQPKAEGIVFSDRQPPVHPALQTSDCPSRYPSGLEAAREHFSLTQSALSLSLTFYEFALVGDRNDDGRYNAAELQDMLESFELTYDKSRPDSVHVTALTGTFDSLRKAGGLERLMTSMGTLYDKGYRLTPHDRSTLDQITR
ncbi:MAG: hypothetical protein ACREIJ_00395 [Nitrospiraceae bacterium]